MKDLLDRLNHALVSEWAFLPHRVIQILDYDTLQYISSISILEDLLEMWNRLLDWNFDVLPKSLHKDFLTIRENMWPDVDDLLHEYLEMVSDQRSFQMEYTKILTKIEVERGAKKTSGTRRSLFGDDQSVADVPIPVDEQIGQQIFEYYSRLESIESRRKRLQTVRRSIGEPSLFERLHNLWIQTPDVFDVAHTSYSFKRIRILEKLMQDTNELLNREGIHPHIEYGSFHVQC